MRKKSIFERALFHIGYVFVLWLAAGLIAYQYLTEPLTIYLYGTASSVMIFGSGLLLFLDPIEKEHYAGKQRLKNQIFAIVCKAFNCNVDELIGKSRSRHLADARGVVAYAYRMFNDSGVVEIGEILCKDHSSISHSISRTNDLINIDKNKLTISTIEIIKEQLFKQQ